MNTHRTPYALSAISADKIFIPTQSLLKKTGREALTAWRDKNSDPPQKHLVVILENDLRSLRDDRLKEREARHANEVLAQIWASLAGSEGRGYPVEIGANLFLSVRPERTIEELLESQPDILPRMKVYCADDGEASLMNVRGYPAEVSIFDKITPASRREGNRHIEDNALYSALCADLGGPRNLRHEHRLPLDFFADHVKSFYPNQYLVIRPIRGGEPFVGQVRGEITLKEDALGSRYIMDSDDLEMVLLPKSELSPSSVLGVHPMDIDQQLLLHALMQPHITRVVVTGRAGSGKTVISYAALLRQTLRELSSEYAHLTAKETDLKEKFFAESRFNHLYFVKPFATIGGHDIGILPGGVHSKIGDLYKSFEDAHDLLTHLKVPFEFLVQQELEEGMRPQLDKRAYRRVTSEGPSLYSPAVAKLLRIEDWSKFRGRTLRRAALFLDEVQNLRPDEVKHLNTRVSPGSLVIMAGDYEGQIDLHNVNQQESGLFAALENFLGKPYFAAIALEHTYRDEGAQDAANWDV